jgi:hypothetical protein
MAAKKYSKFLMTYMGWFKSKDQKCGDKKLSKYKVKLKNRETKIIFNLLFHIIPIIIYVASISNLVHLFFNLDFF